MAGNFQQYLLIDLSDQSTVVRQIPAAISKKYIGGVGLGVYLLHAHNAYDLHPLDPSSPIVFSFSPLVGSPLTTTAKFAILHRSPLTGRLNDSLIGSRFAIAGKKNGIDAIVVVGKAPNLSTIQVDNCRLQIGPAEAIRNSSARDTEKKLRQDLGADFQVAAIGSAGEKMVSYATVSHDGRHAGRGGAGAVLGSKNIKAIALRGDQRIQWSDPEGLVKYARQLSKRSLGPATFKYRELGTAANLAVFNKLNLLPTNNFQLGSIDHSENLALEPEPGTEATVKSGCVACTIGCEHRYEIKPKSDTENPGDTALSEQVRVEYESLFALGSLCGINDRETTLRAMQKCDHYGLDSISTGGSIAFLMECRERGLVDTGPRFGEQAGFLEAIDHIANRSGIGDLLSQGSRQMAHTIGNDSIEFAPQIKGMELPGYDPAKLQTLALGMAVNSRGADHNRSSAYEADFSDEFDRTQLTTEQVVSAIETENRAAILDSLILCKFLRKVFDNLFEASAEMLNLVTGYQYTSTDIEIAAARILDAKKLFNIRCGWTLDEDTVPRRFFSTATTNGAGIDESQFRKMVVEYYRHRGWSDAGQLTQVRVEEIQGDVDSLSGQ